MLYYSLAAFYFSHSTKKIQIKDTKKIISQFVVFTSCKVYRVSLGNLLSGSVKRG